LSAKPLKVFSVEAARRNLAIADVLGDIMILAQLEEKARTGARQLHQLLARLRQRIKNNIGPRELLEDILVQTNYMAYLEGLHTKDAEKLSDAKEHINELMLVADEYDSAEDFLQYVAIMTSSDDGDDERDQVQLLTIHAAKGLEWPLVFVVGLEEGVLPHERSMATSLRQQNVHWLPTRFVCLATHQRLLLTYSQLIWLNLKLVEFKVLMSNCNQHHATTRLTPILLVSALMLWFSKRKKRLALLFSHFIKRLLMLPSRRMLSCLPHRWTTFTTSWPVSKPLMFSRLSLQSTTGFVQSSVLKRLSLVPS
jgi:hypothetical protein